MLLWVIWDISKLKYSPLKQDSDTFVGITHFRNRKARYPFQLRSQHCRWNDADKC